MSDPESPANEDDAVDTDPADDAIPIDTDPTDGDAADTDPADAADQARIQLIVNRESDRAALADLLDDRYQVIVDDELQAVDGYLIGDRMLPAYREAIKAIKADQHPEFCPVLVISRPEVADTVADLLEEPEDPRPLVDEVVTAPVDRPTLYRRFRNLLIRRRQSLELADRIETTERRFQQLFDSTNDALFVIGSDGEALLDCNPAASELLGYDRETLCSMSPAALFDHDDSGAFQSFFETVQRTDSGWTNEFSCLRADGERRLLEISAAVLDAAERPPVVFSARDITDRKRYQEELELRSEAMEGAPVGITITDPDREDNPIVYINEGFEEITGYSQADTLGRNCRFLQGPETSEEPVAEMRAAIDAERPISVELRNYRKDGSPFWNRVTIAPIHDESGELSNFIGFQEDITERKEREQELHLFRKAVENVRQGVLITDRSGEIIHVNPAFETETGYTAAEVKGRTPRVLKSGKHDEAFYSILWETILSGESWESDLINQRKSGELHWVHESISPITDDDGEITHFVAIKQDVSDRRLREQQLSVLNRLLRHNLRNGLNVIRGNADLLTESLPADHQRFLSPIKARAESLSQLSQKVGTVQALFEREDAAGERCTLASLFSDVEREFREQHPSTTFEVVLEGSPVVRADDRLNMALLELLDNAVVHNDSDEPAVTLVGRPPTGERAAEWIEIVVCDNGPGIPESEQQVIESGTETALQHGTGLGLWLAYWTVSLFGGEISIENEESGTRVRLLLPRVDADVEAE